MEIHKPHAWHGWREFLKEYAIIVVGVLTALAAEAVVQSLHERRVAAEAREAVRSELNTDVTNVATRWAWEPCVQSRLAQLRDMLDRAEAGQAVFPGPIGAPVGKLIASQRWEAATAGGRTSLFSSEEQAGFARVYNSLRGLSGVQQEEREAWMQLNALGGLHRLSPQMIYGSRIALSRAAFADEGFRALYQQTTNFARGIGIKGDAVLHRPAGYQEPVGTRILCQPLEPAKGR